MHLAVLLLLDVAFFLTSALNYAMLHMWVMDLVNLAFLTRRAVLVAFPRSRPRAASKDEPRSKLTNLLIGIPVESFLALALISDPRPAASMYSMGSTRAGAAVLDAAEVVVRGAVPPHRGDRHPADPAPCVEATGICGR